MEGHRYGTEEDLDRPLLVAGSDRRGLADYLYRDRRGGCPVDTEYDENFTRSHKSCGLGFIHGFVGGTINQFWGECASACTAQYWTGRTATHGDHSGGDR